MRLKIRSPYKSPSKNFLAANNLSNSAKRTISISDSNPRRSPRIKDKNGKYLVNIYNFQMNR
jgi:hypothetical protein